MLPLSGCMPPPSLSSQNELKTAGCGLKRLNRTLGVSHAIWTLESEMSQSDIRMSQKNTEFDHIRGNLTLLQGKMTQHSGEQLLAESQTARS